MLILVIGILLTAGVESRNIVKPDNSIIEVNQTDCICVPYYLCQNGKIKTDGSGLIDFRLARQAEINTENYSRQCDHYIKICCIPPSDWSDEISSPTLGEYNSKGCGYRNKEGVLNFKITENTNNEAQFAEFPWMVAIIAKTYVNGKSEEVYVCGGSLIHKNVVLTAAHCVDSYINNTKDITIRAGEWDTQTSLEPLPHQNSKVSKIAFHPQYDDQVLYNDLALLFLEIPVEITHNVDIICLPEDDKPLDKTSCIATGWGKRNFGYDGRYQVILKKVELSEISKDACQAVLRNTRLGTFFKLDPSFMCAGGKKDVDV